MPSAGEGITTASPSSVAVGLAPGTSVSTNMPGLFVFPVGLSAGVRSCIPLSGPESFHDRGNFSRAPSAGAEEGGCLMADGAGGASRPCPWRGLYRVSPAFVELFGADGVFFTLRGKFLPMERERGGRARGEEAQPGHMR